MAIGNDGAVLRQLRTLFNVGAIRELTDGQLLERFATSRGEAGELAFAVLLERHGPMVLRVCRSVLADPHETQDAFQATFLVLVQKARGLWVRDSLGPWLHQVAFRTAACARSAAARRRRHERGAALAAKDRPLGAGPGEELEQALHEEIAGLSDRLRVPVVLCDLEGRTHEQAARHLGWPVGTVKSRLARGRERLRDRLRRRGIGPGAALPVAPCRAGGPDGLVPPALIDSTTSAVAQFATAATAAAGSAARLARGVLRSMSMIQALKMAAAVLVLGTAVGAVDLLATRAAPATREDLPAAAAAQRGEPRAAVVAKGVVEASNSEAVFCKVEGRTTIIWLVPEGAKVKKGQFVGELDSSGLQDSLKNQKVATLEAHAAEERARLTREVAEVALVEYSQAISKSEKETKKLQAEVEKAKADELAKRQAWDFAKAREAKLEQQIPSCKLYAPGNGMVVYANDPPHNPLLNHPPQIALGAIVRERQKIVDIHDVDGRMRVNVKVPEVASDRIKPGQPAWIHVDEFANQVLIGKVESINRRPVPNRFFGPDPKVYTARVSIDRQPAGLQLGMTAEVEIFVEP
jgi:RNA polymerase sigma factor (sigma-70 family)